jgi:hypothetical protein
MAVRPHATIGELLEMMFPVWSAPGNYIARTLAELQSVVRESEGKPGGWCEMATNLGVSQQSVATQCYLLAL